MSSPLPTILICCTYVYTMKVLGPKLMENRKPFQLQKVLILYNFLQVGISTWLFYEVSAMNQFEIIMNNALVVPSAEFYPN